MTNEARKLADHNGGVWGQYSKYPVEDWAYEVSNDDTRLGYWDWVLERIGRE